MLRGSSDRYKSLWELTRDIALRALELAACQTAYWKKSSKSREEYKDGGRARKGEGEVEGVRACEGNRRVTRQDEFPHHLLPALRTPPPHLPSCPLITV